MRPSNERQIVVVVEALYNVLTKEEPGAARGQAPAVDFVGVGPKEIAHGAFVGDFLFSVEESNLVNGVNEWGQAAVYAKYCAGFC
jgi:hypothetical protein